MKLNRLRGIGFLIVFGATSACTQTITRQTVTSPITERRTRLDPSEPVLTSEWTLDDRVATGTLKFSSCVSERKWVTSDERTVHREPLRGVGWAFLGVGGVLGIIGAATRDNSVAAPACPQPDLYDQCSSAPAPDNSGADAAILIGAAAVVTGVVILAISPKDEKTVLKSVAHTETTHGTCILPRDLATLSLVLEVGRNRYLHVELGEHGTARVELPAGVRLTPGADLPVLVYRGPAPLAEALPHLQVIGTVHVPD